MPAADSNCTTCTSLVAYICTGACERNSKVKDLQSVYEVCARSVRHRSSLQQGYPFQLQLLAKGRSEGARVGNAACSHHHIAHYILHILQQKAVIKVRLSLLVDKSDTEPMHATKGTGMIAVTTLPWAAAEGVRAMQFMAACQHGYHCMHAQFGHELQTENEEGRLCCLATVLEASGWAEHPGSCHCDTVICNVKSAHAALCPSHNSPRPEHTRASCSTVACQRLFSPPRPPISFSALVSLTVQSATCWARLSFLAVASAYCVSRLWMLASTACRQAGN